MFVIHVTPLIRGTNLESLSYFSSVNYEIGSIVTVPIRGKQQSAIVTHTKPVSTTKTALKAATFSLRKLPIQKHPVVLPTTIRHTADTLANRYPASSGSILYSLLPPDIRNGSKSYPRTSVTTHYEETTPHILTARLDERLIHYKSLIRSVFAHRGSVLLVVPQAADIAYFQTELQKGIEERVVTVSTNDPKLKRFAAFEQLEDTSLSRLIITTPAYAYLERVDLTTIIIEQSASQHYKTRQRPYLDHRDALKCYANVSGRQIVLGDTVPLTEDEVKRRDETYLTFGEEVKRLAFTSPLTIVKQTNAPKPDASFKLFSSELVRGITRTIEANGRVFLYAARRGLAPVVACTDCGHIFRCPDSNTPFSLIRTTTHTGAEERWFISNTSGRKIRAADVCPECGSWRLRERGIGIQHVYDELQKELPSIPITVLDQLTAPSTKKAELIANQFWSDRSGVLLGTQLALPYLRNGVDFSAIVSLDAARAIPTWRADESLFRLLLKLRESTAKEVLVQTRTETDQLLTFATRGAIERFYDDEIKLRKMLAYPPFSQFILLTWSGSHVATKKVQKMLQARLSTSDWQFYPNPNSTSKKAFGHALLRLHSLTEPERTTILDTIRSLPPYIKVEVDPDRIV
jgi:primosomal protein N'